MRILAADPDFTRLAALTAVLRRVCPMGEVHTFPHPQALQAWLEAEGRDFDVLFLAADGPGLTLAQTLKQRRPRTNLIFTASAPDAFRETFSFHASGYLLAPFQDERVAAELSDLRYPPASPKLRVQTFGNFEVFSDGQPVHFRRTRTKELFAYLIDRRGASSTMGELISILWEGRPDTPSVHSQLRNLIADLRSTLTGLGQGNVIRKQRDRIAVDPERVDCDYYHYLDGDEGAFRGEYMSNYSWAEMTLGGLE
jgi:two-component system, LytTR family, response regulator